ncbi:uncharacterized protein A1O5_08555 [Cladophialophora psammophila CBS 110553]|uniref:Major facilitator superfamily (MFS) profile domain-containing protein n=1 Tax=Cladophialophora psammophila CBS 110553 TaxID=1182543 RepID=W9WTI1_9EURO|nr:uncharacterized protein A1O5_08555 [Cladophialophora psammophila CBS 110553]EXJ67941.1 hypothetical protein A1O5_08555 [Cladophialophora psammophila CBS 110553]
MDPSKERGSHDRVEEVESPIVIDQGNGAVLLDISQGKSELGAANLKLSKDGHTVLIPQPSADPNDPLNWSELKKHLILVTIAVAAFQSDFQTAVGVPGLIAQGIEWNLSPTHVNYAGNLNVLMNGIGGVFWMPFIYFWGRAPVLFWVTFTGAFLTLGVCLVEDFTGFYALRALTGFFVSGSLTVGLAFIQDMFFLHEQARKIGIWFAIFNTCVYFAPMLGYYIMAGTGNWRATFWMAFGLETFVVMLIVLFIDETCYRRDKTITEQPSRGNRLLRLTGIWQIRVHRQYFASVYGSFLRLLHILYKPVVLPMYLFYFLSCMWAIGINQSTSILFSLPIEMGGYGMSMYALGHLYWAPIIAIIIGEILGNWANDFVARRYVQKHGGIFKPEARLLPVYFTLILTAPGLIIVGQAIQHRLSWAPVAFGWGMYTAATMIFSPPLMAYALDSYPNAAGELSAWFNFSRVIGGFSVAYYQQAWGQNAGFDVSFGIQAAIAGAAGLIILFLQLYGERLRARGGVYKV